MDWLTENHGSIVQVCLWTWIVIMLFQLFYRGPKPFWVTILNLLLLAGFIYFQWVF